MGVSTREENTMTPDQIAAMRALAGQIRDGERIAHGVPTRVYDLANAVLALLAERVDVGALTVQRDALIRSRDESQQLASEATAEVVRLQAENQAAWNECDRHSSNNRKAEARVASLEAALRIAGARIQMLERALGNCYIMSRREIARILNRSPMVKSDQLTLERWQHVKRFCEETEQKSSILRATLPTEITDGGGPLVCTCRHDSGKAGGTDAD